jgi:hypothetical protein
MLKHWATRLKPCASAAACKAVPLTRRSSIDDARHACKAHPNLLPYLPMTSTISESGFVQALAPVALSLAAASSQCRCVISDLPCS